MFYDYYAHKIRKAEMPDWMKAERYEYCEQYDNREYKETLWDKIKKLFKK
jgi:hypothetical protein